MGGNGQAVISDDAPANPTMEAILAVIEASVQAVTALEDTDAAFDAIVPAPAPFEPGLFFVLAALLGLVAGLG